MSGTRQFVSPEGFSPKREARRRILAAVLVAAVAGCSDNSSDAIDAGDADTDADTDTGDPTPLTAVDLLVVVDDTMGSLNEEPILASGLYGFASALLHPLPGSTYAAVDDLRIAAITTNMGFSSNGEDNDDLWPGTMVDSCSGLGDNGEFQTSMPSQIELANDTIPCDGSAAQCPEGWTCVVAGDVDGGVEGEGVCHTDGDGAVECPGLGNSWAETTAVVPNADLSAQAACLAMQGTSGCGWMQPLQSAATALTQESQLDFVRDNAVLAVVVSTNEDDCSLQDGPGMFAEEEIANQSLKQNNLACGNHPEHLLAPSHFFELFNARKANAGAVLFVGIVGVPYGEQTGAAACQGYGDELGDCNAQDEMLLVPEESESGAWYFRRSCVRVEGDAQVTDAEAPRRFVELANDFGADSYIYSHCNADWSPAFDALGAMIREKLAP